MAVWDKIVSLFGGQLIKDAGDVVDKFVTTDTERAKLKEALSQVVMHNLNAMAATQGEVIKKEMEGSFLQRNWRPIVMLVFAFILVVKWFGWTDPNIPTPLEMELMQLLEIGIGGYVAGRSIEKVAGTVTRNIDLTGLRKKDRNDIIKNQNNAQ